MKQSQSFTEGKILSPLVRFALPVLLAMLLQALYGAADLLIVGQFCTPASVSAVSTGTMVLHAITAVIVGLAMGTTVLLGQRIGEGRAEEAGAVVGASALLFLCMGAFLAIVMQPLSPLVARAMHAPEEAFSETVAYIRICSGGAVFIVAYNVLGSVFRGIGDSRLPLITVAIASALNILGDLLLVAVFRMGPAGAAVATVFAQGVSVLLSFLIIRRRKLPFPFDRSCLRFDRALISSVVRLGTPIALQDLLVSVSFLAITTIVNSLGVIASAGVGVAEKICAFIMLVPSSFMQAMSAFVAQNIGAQKPDRAKRALLWGILVSLGVGAAIGYIAFFHGTLLAGLFARDPAVIQAAAEYLKSYAIDCLLVSFLFCSIGYFSGCGRTKFVMLQGLVGAFCVRIPVSYLMSRILPVSLFLVGLATPASTVVQIVLCFLYFRRMNRPA